MRALPYQVSGKICISLDLARLPAWCWSEVTCLAQGQCGEVRASGSVVWGLKLPVGDSGGFR